MKLRLTVRSGTMTGRSYHLNTGFLRACLENEKGESETDKVFLR